MQKSEEPLSSVCLDISTQGKTNTLDKLRHTHVQDGEAGGIIQKIGTTIAEGRKKTKKQKSYVFIFSVETPTGIYDLCFHIGSIFYVLHRS